MLLPNKSVIGLGLIAALSGCADNTQKESEKSYHITVKVGEKVATITTQGSIILCTKNLDTIPRVPQITMKEDPIQLKKGVLFNGDGFEIHITPDGRYTILRSRLSENDGGGEVAKFINIGGNKTNKITPKEGEDLCRK